MWMPATPALMNSRSNFLRSARARVRARLKNSPRNATGLPVSTADEPLTCVALGSGRAPEEMKTLKNVFELKADTRRKILADAAVLDEAEQWPEYKAALLKLLDRFLSRPDRNRIAIKECSPAELLDDPMVAAAFSRTICGRPTCPDTARPPNWPDPRH